MGAGFLTLPYAFNRSGILFGILCEIAIAVPLLLSLSMVLETMARGDLAFRIHLQSLEDSPGERSSLISKRSEKKHLVVRSLPVYVGETQEGNLMVGREKFEMSELCQMFMGMQWKAFFTLCTALYNYGCLWAFTSVFANALTMVFPIVAVENFYTNYLIYAALFALIVVPLTIVGVHEQVKLQVFLFYCRVLVVVVMVGTSLNAYLKGGDQPLGDAIPTPLFDSSGIPVILPVASYAFLFTPQIPVIAEPVQDKRQLLSIFGGTVIACFCGYTLIGIFVSLLFGSDVYSSCNLHWGTYTLGGYLNSPSANLFGILFVKSLSYYCLAFPAFDVVSAFPLMAIGLGNNMAATCSCFTIDDSTPDEDSPTRTTFFRLLASLPPIVGACFVSNLGAITSYTGISGCVLGFIFPPLLSMYSEHYFKLRNWNPATIHSSSLATVSRRALFVFGLILICFVLGMTIINPMDAHDN